MKRKTLLFLVFMLLCQFKLVSGETEYLFASLIGKGRNYIETHYPDYSVYNSYGDPWNGYYLIDKMTCKGGGGAALLVGFDNPKAKNEVFTVSLYAKDCKEYIPHGTFSEASTFFIETFGIAEYYSDAKITVNNNRWLSIAFPGNVFFDSYIKYDKSGNPFFIANCRQILPSK